MEEFNRLSLMIGKDKLEKLHNSTVLIVGLGGVGGYALEALARSGVGKFIIVDFDKIEISNINRQIIAFHSTIDKYKTEVFKSRILDINPNCEVIIKNVFYSDEVKDIWDMDINFAIDAIDSIKSKKSFIRECINRNIKFISCMGTGRKMDPSKLEIVEIEKTSYDPIAKIIRKWKKDEKIKEKIMVLSSYEKPIDSLNIIPSNCFVPSVAGILIARYVFLELIR